MIKDESILNSLDIIKNAVKALDDKKASDISVIHVGELTVIAEYFIIASASSSSQVKALTDAVDEKLSAEGVEAGHIEGKATGWVLLDYGSVAIHIFKSDAREFYGLDRMWNDGDKLDLSELLDSKEEE